MQLSAIFLCSIQLAYGCGPASKSRLSDGFFMTSISISLSPSSDRVWHLLARAKFCATSFFLNYTFKVHLLGVSVAACIQCRPLYFSLSWLSAEMASENFCPVTFITRQICLGARTHAQASGRNRAKKKWQTLREGKVGRIRE